MSKPQDEIAVKVEHLTKSFKIPLESSNGLKQKLINTIKGRKGYRTFTPLSDISFEIKKGEFFGIVGRNGSGKSTLLKSIAGIYTIESGKVSVDGTLIPFIELGVGFNAELSGRENVYLNGALLGFSNKEMAAMYDEIVDFAELHDFMEERLKNYSSGMQVRLAFSIAIRAKGDILLLDEVLAVGDESFQRKCYEYFAELKREGRTVILVSHSMESVQQFCTKALLLNDGNIELIADPIKVATEYSRLNRPQEVHHKQLDEPRVVYDNVQDLNVKIHTDSGPDLTQVVTGNDKYLRITNTISLKKSVKDAFFGFTIRKQNGELVYWYTTESPNAQIIEFKQGKAFNVEFEIQNIFGEGKYEIGVYIRSNDRTIEYLAEDNAHSFKVVDRGRNGWISHPNVKVSIK